MFDPLSDDPLGSLIISEDVTVLVPVHAFEIGYVPPVIALSSVSAASVTVPAAGYNLVGVPPAVSVDVLVVVPRKRYEITAYAPDVGADEIIFLPAFRLPLVAIPPAVQVDGYAGINPYAPDFYTDIDPAADLGLT